MLEEGSMRNYMALFELITAFQIQWFHLYSVLPSTLTPSFKFFFSRFSPGIVVDVFLWRRIQVTVVHLCHPAVSRENIVQEVRVGQIRVEEDQEEDERDARSVKPVSGVTVVTVHSAWIWSSLVGQGELNRHASWGSVYRYVAVVRYIPPVYIFTTCIITLTVTGMSLC